jgi:hypothetical protein
VSWSASRPCRFTHRKVAVTHWIGVWEGPGAGSDLPLQGIELRSTASSLVAILACFSHFHRKTVKPLHIVAYRPVAKRTLRKQRPFLGNGSVNTFPRQLMRTQQLSYCWKRGVFYVVRAATVAMQRRGKHGSTTTEGLFSGWSVPRSYLEDNWDEPVSTVEFCTGGCEDRT